MKIDAIVSPLELPMLARRDMHSTACVVFDVLRATSTFVTALNNGAKGIIPVSEIKEAVALRVQNPSFLLAGERNGLRIRAAEAGGTDFDFGNSPREFTPVCVSGKTIVSTTTNGTRALKSCAKAKIVLAASFLNLSATAEFLIKSQPEKVLLICAGTSEDVSLEDVLAAGALANLLGDELSDSAQVVRQCFLRQKSDLKTAIAGSKNGLRLLSIPELQPDVAFCSQRDIYDLVVAMDSDGRLQRI